MISKGLVLYYSMTGNTKALVNMIDKNKFDICNASKDKVDLDKYETIIFATSTWGRGVPPKPFFLMKEDMMKLKDKNIGLFGSGNTQYEYFCGALDLLEDILTVKNKIIFKFKFEGYPKDSVIKEFKQIIKDVKY